MDFVDFSSQFAINQSIWVENEHEKTDCKAQGDALEDSAEDR